MNRKTLRHSLQKGTQALGVELRVLPQVLKQLLEAGVSHPLSGGPGLGGALVELLKEGAQGQGQGTGGDGPGLAGAVPLPVMRKWAVDRRRSSRRRSPAIPDRTRAARLPDRRDRA